MKDHKALLLDILEEWNKTDGYDISPEMNEALTRAEEHIKKENN